MYYIAVYLILSALLANCYSLLDTCINGNGIIKCGKSHIFGFLESLNQCVNSLPDVLYNIRQDDPYVNVLGVNYRRVAGGTCSICFNDQNYDQNYEILDVSGKHCLFSNATLQARITSEAPKVFYGTVHKFNECLELAYNRNKITHSIELEKNIRCYGSPEYQLQYDPYSKGRFLPLISLKFPHKVDCMLLYMSANRTNSRLYVHAGDKVFFRLNEDGTLSYNYSIRPKDKCRQCYPTEITEYVVNENMYTRKADVCGGSDVTVHNDGGYLVKVDQHAEGFGKSCQEERGKVIGDDIETHIVATSLADCYRKISHLSFLAVSYGRNSGCKMYANHVIIDKDPRYMNDWEDACNEQNYMIQGDMINVNGNIINADSAAECVLNADNHVSRPRYALWKNPNCYIFSKIGKVFYIPGNNRVWVLHRRKRLDQNEQSIMK